ncbi:MAG: sulfotransferase family 2 domain-containing protein [Bacteroidota bacterium]
MILSHKKQFIYIHLYKTGGTSIRRILEKHDASYNLIHRAKSLVTKNPVLTSGKVHKHADAKTIRREIGPEIYDNYFKFVFVRNPWDWQVSLYFYVLRDDTNHHYEIIKSFKGFDDYIRWRCTQEVRLQTEYILDEDDTNLVDFIGKYENFQQDFDTICDRIDIPRVQLPHLNAGKGRDYHDFYTPETRDLVYKTYQKDIDMLGYDF